MSIKLAYVNVFVTDLQRSVAFFESTLGLEVKMQSQDFGYASFATEHVGFALAQTEDKSLTGRHTGVGFAVTDLPSMHEGLVAKGVTFTMQPEKQPWGGFMAMFQDPDGNIYYLDEMDHE